jgi:SAM-dependent methyltransferase
MNLDTQLEQALSRFVRASNLLDRPEWMSVRIGAIVNGYILQWQLLREVNEPRQQLVDHFDDSASLMERVRSEDTYSAQRPDVAAAVAIRNEDLYGKVYAALTDEEYSSQANRLFRQRLERNLIAPEQLFGGMTVLDAGCGVGKFTVQIALSGAKHVYGRDLSAEAIRVAGEKASALGLADRVQYETGSVLDLQFPSRMFDVVWCNSVAHVTGNLIGTVTELARVLKEGGSLFLYVNGEFGVYQKVVQALNAASIGIPEQLARHHFHCLGLSPGEISRAVATICVPYEFTPKVALEALLRKAGFSEINIFGRGADGDFIERVREEDGGRLKFGEAELRVLCRKSS